MPEFTDERCELCHKWPLICRPRRAAEPLPGLPQEADITTIEHKVSFGSNATGPGNLARHLKSRLLRKRSNCCAATNCREGPIADIQEGYMAGLDALKRYLLLLKKYRPASFKRSNSLSHPLSSPAERSPRPPTNFSMIVDSPLL
jgi:hypothetical protein